MKIRMSDKQVNYSFGSPKIPKIGTLAALEAHNFLFKPPIEVNFKAKL
jgi:hypothetical protein